MATIEDRSVIVHRISKTISLVLCISSRAATQGISPNDAEWEDIDTNMIWQPKTYVLFGQIMKQMLESYQRRPCVGKGTQCTLMVFKYRYVFNCIH